MFVERISKHQETHEKKTPKPQNPKTPWGDSIIICSFDLFLKVIGQFS